MKPPYSIIDYLIILGLALLCPCTAFSEIGPNSVQVESTTSFSYQAGPTDSLQVARALALYGAKYKSAVTLLGRLAEKGFIQQPGSKQAEIICLMAEELSFSLIEESFDKDKRIFSITIKGKLSLADFVRIEIMNAASEEREAHLTLKEEMEPKLSPEMVPGRELSKAYRYIRNHHWRMAVIYLDHLEKKYPHWGPLFYAKAVAFQGMHETEQALAALSAACRKGTKDACLRLHKLKPVN